MTDWTKTFVRRGSSLRDVLRTIDVGELQIALVVDEETRLQGVITDGDVRRALLRGLTLEAQAEEVMTRAPVTATPGMKLAAIERLMHAHSLHQVPVIDERGVIVSLALHGTLLPRERLETEVFLMVGGLGKRLGNLTKRVPKPLLRVGDKPILEIILDGLLTQGFYRFRMAVNYRAELIERHFGSGGRWGAEIRYLRETQPLGTAGALGLVETHPSGPFLVINGDILTRFQFRDLVDFHRAQGAAGTVAVSEYGVEIPFGVVQLNGDRVTELIEKPTERRFISAGIYVLDPSVLSLIPKDTPYDMTTLLHRLLGLGRRVCGFRIDGYWLDVGRVADFEQAHEDFEATWERDEAEP